MPTQVQSIIAQGIGRSFHSRPDTLANQATELVGIVYRELAGFFAVAGRVNRDIVSRRYPVGFSGTGWVRPTGIDTVWRIETAAGLEVATVPIDDLAAAGGDPAVTFLDGVYQPTGRPEGPTSGTLTFFATRPPAALTGLLSELDPVWPEHYNSLLELRVAAYLARKDKRAEDVAGFEEEWDAWFIRFVGWCESFDQTLTRRTGMPRNSATPAIAVLKQVVGHEAAA